MAYDKFDASDGVWRTIGGRRIFIKNKQPLSEAMKQSGKFKKVTREDVVKAKAQLESEDLKEQADFFKKREQLSKTKKEQVDYHDRWNAAIEDEKRTKESLEAYDNPTEEINRNDLEGKHIAKVEPTKEYTSNFLLEAEVNDFDKAQAYLTDDDMTKYVPEELKGVITKAEWTLDDESSGHVSIQTTRDLTDTEKKSLQSWIDGQNSDGLGEGFEQQQFAETYYDPYTGDGPYTYNEAESEISNRFDNMDPRDYSDYLDEALVDDAVDSYLQQNGYDYDDYEARETAREDILDDPESYLEWEAIDDAKNKAIEGDDYYNVDSWYNMSSIRRNGNGFEEKTLYKKDDEVTWNGEKTGKVVDIPTEDRVTVEWEDGEKNTYSNNNSSLEKMTSKSSSSSEYEIYKQARQDPRGLETAMDDLRMRGIDIHKLDKKYGDRYWQENKNNMNKATGTMGLKTKDNKEYDVDLNNSYESFDGVLIAHKLDNGKYLLNNREFGSYHEVDDISPKTLDKYRTYQKENSIPFNDYDDIADKYPEVFKRKGNNDWVRNAFNKYKQEHPNTKMSLQDFMKNYKK